MCSIFDRPICLTGNRKGYISLFKKKEEFELFQLRMGLKSLCQNTLVYSLGKDADGTVRYEMQASPHSKEFYSPSCLRFCCEAENDTKCHNLMWEISSYFYEKTSIENSVISDYTLFPYDPALPEERYIRYRCPYVGLYKFGFPIYVNHTVVAILFTGQFSIRESVYLPVNRRLSRFIRNMISGQSELALPPGEPRYSFYSERQLMAFAESHLLPVVREFTQQAQTNYIEKQTRLLKEIIEAQTVQMEKDIMAFLTDMDTNLPKERFQTSMQSRFWKIVEKNLEPYLKQLDAEKLTLFTEEHPFGKVTAPASRGFSLYPEFDQSECPSFNFQNAQTRDPETFHIYTTDSQGRHCNTHLFHCIENFEPVSPANSDVLAYLTKLQPFALAITYSENARIITDSALKQERHVVLKQLTRFFTKVGQEMAYLDIRMSEHRYKTILRIYRHEIAHQVTVLNNNNWFLDIKQLQRLDENKLRLIAMDQRQSIVELDFMTQNIKVITGPGNGQYFDIHKERLIDVNTEIINKAISLQQRKKQEKTLWFSIHNTSKKNLFKSNLELVDMIFFNLMSNAIKYAYPGTKIVIGFGDTDSFLRPHKISLTDYGVAVKAEYESQIFQMYYRGDTSSQVEGSGIGLYVADWVASILGAKLSWKCTKVSDYNIPILMRYLQIPQAFSDKKRINYQLAEQEYRRLVNESRLYRIFNDEYLRNSGKWSKREIQGEIMKATYEVTFTVEL